MLMLPLPLLPLWELNSFNLKKKAKCLQIRWVVAASSLLCSLLKRHPARSVERFSCIFICVFIGSHISIYLAGRVHGKRGQFKQFIAFLLCASIDPPTPCTPPPPPHSNAAIVRESAANSFAHFIFPFFWFWVCKYAGLEFETEFIDRHYVTSGGTVSETLAAQFVPHGDAQVGGRDQSAELPERESINDVYTHTYTGEIYSWTE